MFHHITTKVNTIDTEHGRSLGERLIAPLRHRNSCVGFRYVTYLIPGETRANTRGKRFTLVLDIATNLVGFAYLRQHSL